MRPLIPRARPGDILKGTRNLRGYLQAASTLNYLNEISHGEMRREAKSRIFRPCKNERFLVTVNAWGMFGICSLDTDVVLLFANPPDPIRTGKNYLSRLQGSARMDPTIFSKWFIRTTVKMTALQDWPNHAHYMWMGLHLNLTNVRHDSAPTWHYQKGPTGPFYMKNQIPTSYPRDQLYRVLHQWVPRGATRPSAPTGRNTPSVGFGPRLEETLEMRREIEQLCSNPRIAQRLKAEANYVYQAFIQNQ